VEAVDPLLSFDWAAHWRRLVEARDQQFGDHRPSDFWDRRAQNYSFSIAMQPDGLLGVLEPYLAAHRSAIDVGAGSGRHAVPLAARLDWVTAVEPSEGMRSHLPHLDNLTVVASRWEDAEVAPADLVLSAHVLYSIAAPVPFIRKMEASAKERVFICLRDGQPRLPAELLWQELTGQARARQPQFYDLYNLLRGLGVQPDVTTFRTRSEQRFRSLEEAVEDSRLRLGRVWDEAGARRWLAENLNIEPDGSLRFDGGPMTSGVAHWRPPDPA
jgi:SAM-dependent methyltransferase